MTELRRSERLAENKQSSLFDPPTPDDPPAVYSKKMLHIIDTAFSNQSNRDKIFTVFSIPPNSINLEEWTRRFIGNLNAFISNNKSIGDLNKILLTQSKTPGTPQDNERKNTMLQIYYQTNDASNRPFQGASILSSIGDGTCLIHSCFNALSPTYRSLQEKHQQLIGLSFRKYTYANSGTDYLTGEQEVRAKKIFPVTDVDDPKNNVTLEETFLTNEDITSLTETLRKNILVFHERVSATNPSVQENQCEYFCVNAGPTICLYLRGEIHFDTIEFPGNTFEQTDEWVRTNLSNAYEACLAKSNRNIIAEDILGQATQFVLREIPQSIQDPADVLLGAVSTLYMSLFPPIKHDSHDDDDDAISVLSNDEQQVSLRDVKKIQAELDVYLKQIYQIMYSDLINVTQMQVQAQVQPQVQPQVQVQVQPQTNTSGVQTTNIPDTTNVVVHNSSECNATEDNPIAVQVRNIEQNQFGTIMQNTLTCA